MRVVCKYRKYQTKIASYLMNFFIINQIITNMRLLATFSENFWIYELQ